MLNAINCPTDSSPSITSRAPQYMVATVTNLDTSVTPLFASVPTVLLAHCEHTPTVEADSARLRAQYGDDATAAMHPQARSAEACWRSSSLAVSLARQFDTRLHVLHLTTARELALFDVYRGKGVDEGKKSLAFRIILQAADRTLVDEEVEQAVKYHQQHDAG